jgi:hypothetical protein
MKKFIAVFVFIAAAVSLYAQSFSWDIKFIQGRERESVAINRAIRMVNGENFWITVTPASDCFYYVVIYDSSREIAVLHDTPLKAGNEISLGPFEIEDPPGTETLYVITSMARQTNLESLIQGFNSNPSRQNTNNLYREVVNLQTAASGLGEPASSFVPSGGTSRGDSPEYVTRFSGKDMYVRAITIRH